MRKVWLSWSSGKDSAWTLHRLREDSRYDVCGLFTTVNEKLDRVTMHAVRRILLEEQAKAVGVDLYTIPIPSPCSNSEYERRMARFCLQALEAGITAFAFGDLFLEDVRNYRVNRLKESGVEPIFPLWKTPTGLLAKEMVESGLRAKLTCVDPRRLSPDFAGRNFDLQLLRELPESVDPCGENGEFHSFVYQGPMFKYPLEISVGTIVRRDRFVFADIAPTSDGPSTVEKVGDA